MANKLIRIGYTKIIPANPGRPPAPPRTVTVTNPVSSALPSAGGGSGGSSTGSGSWVYIEGGGGSGSLDYGGGGRYIWVPA